MRQTTVAHPLRRTMMLVVCCLSCGFQAGLTQVDPSAQKPTTFSSLSFEQLSQIQIVTASKRPEILAETPAAVSVLTGEQIHRLGVTTLPDALRHVPGMDVSMVNSSQWGVSARGFNGQYANQLLVMMDGRSIYNTSFGAVFWSGQDTFFEDIDRIEVVRGPGGSLWGANAVNGVINILTKSAKDTQGTVFTGGGGGFNELISAVRHGFQVSENTFARVYAKYDRFGQAPLASGGDTPDDWDRLQGGFRLDSTPDDATTFTLQSDAHRVEEGATYFFPSFDPPDYVSAETYRFKNSGANLLGRWTRQLAGGSAVTSQAYYDHYQQKGPVLHQRLHTLDLDVQHNFNWGEGHVLTWGAGYRYTWDTIIPSRVLRVPGHRKANDQLLSLFAQNEFALVLKELFLTLGSKIEHNDYTGWEFQPNARLTWHPDDRQTVWGAVSRAVATPNHLSAGAYYDYQVIPPGGLGPSSPAVLVQVRGRSDRAEKLLAFETGYRIQPVERVAVDVAAFHNDYSQLLVTEIGAPVFGMPPIVPLNWANRIDGRTKGVEVALEWRPLDAWRLQGGYTWFESDVARGSVGRDDGDASPRHKFGVRSSVDFGRHWQWDAGLRYVGQLESIDVPSYTELDFRLAWSPDARWEISLVGQNLLHESHFEYPRGLNPLKSEVPRSFYGKVTWRWSPAR